MTTPPTHDPLDYIRTLQETITGSGNYDSGFPILKELLQNAEDSQASHFDYGYCREIQSGEHPLLKCPGIFSVSNGYFRLKNARKIAAAIGGSSKISEENSIGKFGLGLKSVFNLCEAFFYISDEEIYKDDYDEFNGFNFFNPWSVQGKDHFHDWKIPTERDRDSIIKNFKFILDREEYKKTNKNWLLIWIPLRLHEHKPNKEFDRDYNRLGCIREEYFDSQPNFLSTPETQNNFSQILPMLSSVECIRFWERSRQRIKLPKFQINYRSNSGKRTRELAETPTTSRFWSGNIEIDQINSLEFWGVEKRIDTTEVNLISELQEKFKSFGNLQPHIAIVISRKDESNANAKLMIWPAVFLPVGNSSLQEINLELSHSYQITIHGNFIPSKERTSIEGIFGNCSHSEKGKWNSVLYENVMPLFLPVLAQVSEETNVDEVNMICETMIKKVDFFKKDKEYILQEQGFLCVATEDLKDLKWQLVDNDTPILGIPTFLNNLSSVFPALKEINQETILVDQSKSNLINKNTHYNWRAEQIQRAIDTLKTKEFIRDVKFLEFLIKLLNDHRSTLTEEIENSLIKLLKKVFLEIDSKSWKQYKELINVLKPPKWLSFKDLDDDLLKEFYKNEDIKVFVVSEKVKKNDGNSLNSKNGFDIFQTVVSFYKDKPENILNFVLSIMDIITKEEKSKFLDLIEPYKFIKGSELSISGMTHNYYSIQDINQYRLVFSHTESSIELAKKLYDALENIRILFVPSNRINKLVSLREFNRATCFEILSQRLKLSQKPEDRKQLLEELVK